MSASLRDHLVGAGYRAAWRLTRAVPERVAARAFEWAGARAYRRNERRRVIVTENLRPLVDPAQLENTVRGAFLSYARYWMEAFRMQDLSDAEFEARIDLEASENLDDAKAAGGCVLAVPHLGNWDAGGRYVGKHWGITVVVEVLRPRALFERFIEFRKALGMEIIPLHKGEDVTARCVEALDRGTLLALLCDRDLSGKGVPVTMFGRHTKLAAGPAVVALRARKNIVPGCIYQQPGGRWLIWSQEPISTQGLTETPENVEKLMQEVAHRFERYLRRAPEQWHAFGRQWID